MTYTVQHAKTNLDQLLSEAEAGKDVFIERDGKPAIRLALTDAVTIPLLQERILGQDRGMVEYDDSSLAALTDEELAEYGFGFLLENKLVSENAEALKTG